MALSLSEPAILNVLDPWYNNGTTMVGMIAGTDTSISFATAQQNALVLQTIIDYAQTINCDQTNPYGAIILFPGHDMLPTPPTGNGDDDGAQYFLALPTTGSSAAVSIGCNWPLLFKGTGNVKLVMRLEGSNNTGDMFSITNNGQDNTGGITFEDLTFKYPDIPMKSTPPPPWAAIHLLSAGSAENIRAIRCIFEDCPLGLWAQDGLQISVLECLFKYSNNVGTAISLGDIVEHSAAKEVFITDCLFAGGDSSVPNGSTALHILSCDEVWVSNCHIDGFTNGIQIVPGPTGWNAAHLHFNACTVFTGIDANGNLGTCCLLQPQTDGVHNGAIGQVVFTACYFELGENATVPGT